MNPTEVRLQVLRLAADMKTPKSEMVRTARMFLSFALEDSVPSQKEPQQQRKVTK